MAMTFKDTNWPPRSPHEALLSSPSGRKKLSQRYARRSASPSPFKPQPTLGLPEVKEDEETLKLELKRIEAKLKLKKLQAQAQSIGYSGSLSRSGVAPSQSQTRTNSREPLRANTNRLEARDRTRPQLEKLQDQFQTSRYSGRLNRGVVEPSQSRTRGNSSASASSTSNTNELQGHHRTHLQSKKLQSQSQTSGYSGGLNRAGVEPSQLRTRENSSASSTEQTNRLEGRDRTQLQSTKLQAQSQTSRYNGSLNRVDVEYSQSRTRTNSSVSSTANTNRLEGRDRSRLHSKSTTSLQVPVSPPHKHIVTQQPRSPGRVLLGIDKGLKGKDVSLRRAPYLNSKHLNSKQQSPRSSNHDQRRTPYITPTETRTKTKTFSERMAELKANTNVEKKRADEARMNRSKGFNVDRKELEELKKKADTHSATSTSVPPRHTRTIERGFSREEILKSYNKPTGGLLHREATASGVRNTRERDTKVTTSSGNTSRRTSPTSTEPSYRRSTLASEARKTPSPPTTSRAAKQPSAEPAEGFDKHSALHLSKRILPEAFLARTLRGKKILRVPDLLRGDDAHDDSADIVVMGVIASKSAPRDHHSRPASSTTNSADAPRGKYMALTLTDLKWEVTLFLFASAFRRFWKLTPGTVVAILNPTIMPPRPSDPAGAAVSLALSSADDTVLELGTARDLGHCASIRRDGRPCAAWVDARHTAHCAFHVDRQVDRTRAARMEVNSVPLGAPCGGRAGGFFGRGGRHTTTTTTTTGLRQEGPQYDRGSASRYFVAGRSAAALLDEGEGARAGGAERLRLRLAAREKEREVARRLGAVGGGVGGEYLSRVAGGVIFPEEGERENAPPPRPDARSLGLVRSGAGAVTLSPAKKRGRGEGSGSGEEGGGKGRKRGRWEEEVVMVAEGDEEEDEVDYFLEMGTGRMGFSSGESDGLEIV